MIFKERKIKPNLVQQTLAFLRMTKYQLCSDIQYVVSQNFVLSISVPLF